MGVNNNEDVALIDAVPKYTQVTVLDPNSESMFARASTTSTRWLKITSAHQETIYVGAKGAAGRQYKYSINGKLELITRAVASENLWIGTIPSSLRADYGMATIPAGEFRKIVMGNGIQVEACGSH